MNIIEEYKTGRRDFSHATLTGANLRGATLTGANLTGAYLAGATLTGATLADANLRGAYLADATLTDAYLAGATLRGATLTGATLTDANLTQIKHDFFARCLYVVHEVEGLLVLLRAGKVNGQVYQGDCACFVGSIANLRGCDYQALPGLRPDSSSPTERWFLAIDEGDTPETSVVAKITEEWIVEFLSLLPQNF